MARRKGERFPSDAKRSRPHVKIHLSARSHPRYGEVFDHLESRAICWGLWLLAVQYHAAQTGGRVSLSQGDVAWLTGRTQPHHALSALRALCERMKYPMSVEGRRVVVEVRNLQRKQGFAPQTPDGAPKRPKTSDTDTDTDTDTDKSRTASPSASSPPEWSLRASEHLIEMLRPVPGSRIPQGAKRRWASEIHALSREVQLGEDPGPEAHIIAAIDWALGPENLGREYEVVIRSGRSLREKWPQLVAASRRRKAETKSADAIDSLLAEVRGQHG